MTPIAPVSIVLPREFDYAAQLREQDTAMRNMLQSAGDVLRKVFPQATAEVGQLQDAATALFCAGTERQLEAIEHNKGAAPYSYYPEPPTPAEELVKACERRDALTAAIAQAEEANAQIPVEGVAGMFEASILRPMREQLQGLEEQVTWLQKRVEAASAQESL